MAGDVGKLAYQADTQAYHKLTAVSPITWVPAQPDQSSPLVSRAGHVWFYGLSPDNPATTVRTINLGSPGTMWAAIYAPSHDFAINGNPDIYGVMVAKSFYQNGNCAFHFDKQLLNGSAPTDYRIASYIEDIR